MPNKDKRFTPVGTSARMDPKYVAQVRAYQLREAQRASETGVGLFQAYKLFWLERTKAWMEQNAPGLIRAARAAQNIEEWNAALAPIGVKHTEAEMRSEIAAKRAGIPPLPATTPAPAPPVAQAPTPTPTPTPVDPLFQQYKTSFLRRLGTWLEQNRPELLPGLRGAQTPDEWNRVASQGGMAPLTQATMESELRGPWNQPQPTPPPATNQPGNIYNEPNWTPHPTAEVEASRGIPPTVHLTEPPVKPRPITPGVAQAARVTRYPEGQMPVNPPANQYPEGPGNNYPPVGPDNPAKGIWPGSRIAGPGSELGRPITPVAPAPTPAGPIRYPGPNLLQTDMPVSDPVLKQPITPTQGVDPRFTDEAWQKRRQARLAAAGRMRR